MPIYRSLAGGLGVLAIIFVFAVIALLAVGPIPQDASYHAFADTRATFGIPNFSNVVSNIGFVVVGIIGLKAVLGQIGRDKFDLGWEKRPYVIFFSALTTVSVGSAYYHLNPNTESLFWDRLPMTIAFMALFSAIIADRIDQSIGAIWGLPILILLGVLSVAYWNWTESLGRGDLRPYVMVQFLPLILIPIISRLFTAAEYTRNRDIVWIVVWYLAAKVFEFLDVQIFDLSGQLISGHSLKHVASAVAGYFVYRMVAYPAKSTSNAYPPS